jgi:hypothetical protein
MCTVSSRDRDVRNIQCRPTPQRLHRGELCQNCAQPSHTVVAKGALRQAATQRQVRECQTQQRTLAHRLRRTYSRLRRLGVRCNVSDSAGTSEAARYRQRSLHNEHVVSDATRSTVSTGVTYAVVVDDASVDATTDDSAPLPSMSNHAFVFPASIGSATLAARQVHPVTQL